MSYPVLYSRKRNDRGGYHETQATKPNGRGWGSGVDGWPALVAAAQKNGKDASGGNPTRPADADLGRA